MTPTYKAEEEAEAETTNFRNCQKTK